MTSQMQSGMGLGPERACAAWEQKHKRIMRMDMAKRQRGPEAARAGWLLPVCCSRPLTHNRSASPARAHPSVGASQLHFPDSVPAALLVEDADGPHGAAEASCVEALNESSQGLNRQAAQGEMAVEETSHNVYVCYVL